MKMRCTVSGSELMSIARNRLETYDTLVANRGEETEKGGPQVAWLVTQSADPERMQGKRAIARRIADHLETALG